MLVSELLQLPGVLLGVVKVLLNLFQLVIVHVYSN